MTEGAKDFKFAFSVMGAIVVLLIIVTLISL
jgi:hypothetical protein